MVNCSLPFPIGLFWVCLSSYYTKYQDGSDTKVHQISVNLKWIVMSAYFGPLKMCMFLWTNKIIPCLTFMLYKTLFSNEILGWHSSYQADQEIGIRSYFSCLLDLNLQSCELHIYRVIRVEWFWIMNLSPNLAWFWNKNSTPIFEKVRFLIWV